MQGAIRLLAFSLASVALPPLYGGDRALDSANHASGDSAALVKLLSALESPDYANRISAASSIDQLLARPGDRAQLQHRLRSSWHALSFDVRQRLVAMGLPPTVAANQGGAKPAVALQERVTSLVTALASERYLDRSAALHELRSIAERASHDIAVYPALKHTAADTSLSMDVRLLLRPLLESARYRWLTNDSGATDTTPSHDQIASWISTLAAVETSQPADRSHITALQAAAAAREAAERELLDALAQSTSAVPVQQAVAAALAQERLGGEAVARLRRISEFARPGLAVEYWRQRQIVSVQFFIVGVAAQAPGAIRPTRFDRVADGFAVCAAGNALRPGEYPLGIAYPHPREQAAFYHLVSLPTARERIIYQYENQTLTAAERLATVTRRTLAPALRGERALDDAQLWLLGQLDQSTVARFLRSYFAEVPDAPFDQSQLAPMLTDVSSVHRTACLMLALDGSHEVVPMLVEAAKRKRALPLDADEPQAMPWIAALAIAEREPWNGVDRFLAGLVDCTDRISFGDGTQGDVGGTAAAMLLERHGEIPEDFGLAARQPLERGLHDRFEAPINVDYRRRMFEDRLFKQLAVTPHCFTNETGRDAVRQWWRHRQPADPHDQPTYTPHASAVTARTALP